MEQKIEVAVGALALVLGALVHLQADGVGPGWWITTAPAWGGALVALVAATVRDAVAVGEALDAPTGMSSEAIAAIKAAAIQGKVHGTDFRQNQRCAHVRISLHVAAVREGAAH